MLPLTRKMRSKFVTKKTHKWHACVSQRETDCAPTLNFLSEQICQFALAQATCTVSRLVQTSPVITLTHSRPGASQCFTGNPMSIYSSTESQTPRWYSCLLAVAVQCGGKLGRHRLTNSAGSAGSWLNSGMKPPASLQSNMIYGTANYQ